MIDWMLEIVVRGMPSIRDVQYLTGYELLEVIRKSIFDPALYNLLCRHGFALDIFQLGTAWSLKQDSYLLQNPVDGVIDIFIAINFVHVGNLTCMFLLLTIPLRSEKSEA